MALSTRIGLAIVAALLAIGAAAFALVWRPAIAVIDPPNPETFAPDLVKRGRQLAAIGNCMTCHTVRGGSELAGGLPMATPFGTVFSTNITPDPQSGIGYWSEEAFQRAMRSGVDRAGQHLYPAFPYDHFARLTDDDNRALYAFLMTRQPVPSTRRDNELSFPYNQRPLIAVWKMLFLRQDGFRADPAKSAEWNRGAYLVEGLAHCGACHTPRNRLGAERSEAAFAGGEAENWQAYAINAQSSAAVPWTEEALISYLQRGWHAHHGVARGPMAQVVDSLASVDSGDIRAIATYAASLSGPRSPEQVRRGEAILAEAAKLQSAPAQTSTSTSSPPAASAAGEGAALYAAACASCHETGRSLPFAGIDLRLATGMRAPDPRNAANTILYGLPPLEGERSPIMPGFASSMTDQQVTSLLQYLRTRFSDQAAWSNVAETVAHARQAQAAFLETAAQPPNIAVNPPPRDEP